MLVAPIAIFAQTVTVPGNYTTIPLAIASFSGDTSPADNVIEITTVGPHTGVITVDPGMTIRGNVPGGARPIILVQINTDGNGIVIGNGSALNRLENLIMIPDRTNPPTANGKSGLRIQGAGTECTLDNILMCPNNGSDQPVSTDPLVKPDLTGATLFPSWLVYCGASAEAIHMTNTVLTANFNPSAAAGSQDLILISNTASATGVSTIGEGCIFSFSGRMCAQISRSAIITGAVDNPVIFHSSGLNPNNGVMLFGITLYGPIGGGVYHTFENAIISEAGSDGILVDTYGDSLVSLDHVAIVNCKGKALHLATGDQPLTMTDSTFVGNNDVIYTNAAAVNISANDCIFAGTGPDGINKIEVANAAQTFNITNCAIVTTGSYAVEEITGVGTINQTNVINADPGFVNTDDLRASGFLNVTNSAYATAGTGGIALSGYGAYGSSVADWERY